MQQQQQQRQPYTFSLEDTDAWKAYLDENGFVVIKQVADTNHILKATSLMWNFLESLGTGIKKDDPETWKNANWPHALGTGIISQYGIGQSDFMWYCRLIGNVRKIFELIWNDKDLLVSFDGAGLFRSSDYPINAGGPWFHIDQNPTYQPGRCAVQGMLNLIPSRKQDGGFMVVPGSHRHYNTLTELKIGQGEPNRRFFSVTDRMAIYQGVQPVKVEAGSGDFILWDSRTAHCNCPPRDPSKKKQIIRMVAYICMTPKSMAESIKALSKERKRAVEQAVTTNHWPHYFCANRPPKWGHKSIPKTFKTSVSSLVSLREAKELIGTEDQTGGII